MYHVFIIVISLLGSVNSFYTHDYEENTPRQFIEKLNELDSNEEEPIGPELILKSTNINNTTNTTNPTPTVKLQQASQKLFDIKNLLCDDFEEYARNCTAQYKRIYNSSNVLPRSHELNSWCSALKRLARCEYDWNTDCKDVSEKNFNEITVEGQLHVLEKVCHDDWFSIKYDNRLDGCINAITQGWEECFTNLTSVIGLRKNATSNWMHYETHFYLCCARTRFRRCTLDVLLNFPLHCTTESSIMVQKFSAYVSEGEVFQDCNFNMVYSNCPGGDPRPPTAMVTKLIGHDPRGLSKSLTSRLQTPTTRLLFLTMLCFHYIFK